MVAGSWGWSVGWLLVLGGIVSESVHDLDADLLGQGKFHSLAGGSGQGSDALFKGLGDLLDLGDGDALFLGEILAADPWQGDGLVHTGLDGLGIGDGDCWFDHGDHWHVVASLLGDFLAVVVSVAVVSISWGGLADSDHLGVTFLVEGNLNSLGGGIFSLLLVRVGADLVIDFLNALSTDSASNIITLLFVYNDLDGKLNWIADSFESRGAYFSSFNNILN